MKERRIKTALIRAAAQNRAPFVARARNGLGRLLFKSRSSVTKGHSDKRSEMSALTPDERRSIKAKLMMLEHIVRTNEAVIGLSRFLDTAFVAEVTRTNQELVNAIREVRRKMSGEATADALLAILCANQTKGERLKAIVAAHMDATGVKCLK